VCEREREREREGEREREREKQRDIERELTLKCALTGAVTKDQPGLHLFHHAHEKVRFVYFADEGVGD
jgi:hypothetical protein